MHPVVFKKLFPHEISLKAQAELEAFNIVQDAIELVTVNGYPFAMLSASGMQGFIKSRLQSIRSEGHALSINRVDIVKKIAEESDLIRKSIAAEFKGELFSIMFDVCTIATLSMIGVNATRMKGDDVVCRSLGTIKIEDRHTSVNLAAILCNILSEFDLSLEQVFSITTGTAKNATATSEILNLIVNTDENVEDIAEDSIFDMDAEDDGFDFGIDIENEFELQNIIDKANAHTQLVKEMADHTSLSVKLTVVHMRPRIYIVLRDGNRFNSFNYS